MGEYNNIQELMNFVNHIETDYPGSPLTEALREILNRAGHIKNPQPVISIF